ncbi:MAG TPA: aminobenzoyl-glutamate transporter, partial [Marinilabiliaceae bacterium]|nr:aminobenzoyl-glutamate transporter [Marinilabiliaceae bacterium]
LKRSFVVFLIWLVIILIGILPENGVLRGTDGGILSSPLIKGIITFLFLIAASAGIVYGVVVGKFKNDTDVANGMADSLKTLAAYIVLVFFAAQFVAYFKWSNLGIIMAVNGADALIASNLGLIPLMILFVLFSASVNLIMGSASAKWALLAPVFIPIFMLLGYSPELSQAVYRVGDSVTNIISPMMSYFALIIAYFQKYDKNAGLGTIIATMLPYSIIFFIGWTLFLIAWILLEISLGPGVGIYYQLPG